MCPRITKRLHQVSRMQGMQKGHLEKRGNMKRRMEDEEVPGTQLPISPAREHDLAPSLPHTSICSVRNPEVVRISGRLKGCSCLTIRR